MADARAQITRPISPPLLSAKKTKWGDERRCVLASIFLHERTHKRTHKLTKQGTHAHADKCWRVRAACMPHARCQPSPRKKSPRACECACACMHCTCLYIYCCSSLSNCPLGMHSARNHPAPSDENVRSQTTTSTQYFPHLRQVRGFRQLGLQTTDLQCHGNLFRRGTTSSRIKLKNTTPFLK